MGMGRSLAQPPYPYKFSTALAQRVDVQAALRRIDAHFEEQVAERLRITEISAPSEQVREARPRRDD